MLLIFLFLITFTGALQIKADETFHYRIKPIPVENRTDIEISLKFKVASKTKIPVNLPTGCYSLSDLYRSIKTFEGKDGTTILPGKSASEKIIKPGPNSDVSIQYRFSFDPERMNKIAFAPAVGRNFFHIGTCQWMLKIGDPKKKRSFIIKMVDAPKNWGLYSSMGENPGHVEIKDSFRGLSFSAIGGGDNTGIYRFKVRGKPVAAFVHGDFGFSKREMFQSIQRIVMSQRKWMNDYKQPFYIVAIRPKQNVIAGTAPANYMVGFIDPDASKDELNRLISHEMFHHWLPGKIYIKPGKGNRSFRNSWFYEGMNEYFARRMLLETNLITPKQFAKLTNQDIIDLADNPFKAASYSDLVIAAKEKRFRSNAQKLSYYRGAMIALNWEAELKRQKRTNLKKLIRNLNEIASQFKGSITEEQFFTFMAKHGIDARSDIRRFVYEGTPISIDPYALGANFILKKTGVTSFDPGFSTWKSLREKKITGVDIDGAAYKAGIRNGMQLVKLQNFNRFSNGWKVDSPLGVTIRQNSEEKIIKYFPFGKPRELLLFKPAEKRNSTG